jgi:hypothetical protein
MVHSLSIVWPVSLASLMLTLRAVGEVKPGVSAGRGVAIASALGCQSPRQAVCRSVSDDETGGKAPGRAVLACRLSTTVCCDEQLQTLTWLSR